MDCGESVGSSALSDRLDVTGRLVSFRLCALTQRNDLGYTSTFHVTVAVIAVSPVGLPHESITGWRELLHVDAKDCLELEAEVHLATPGLRPGDVMHLQVLRDRAGLRVLEMSAIPATSTVLRGPVCEVRSSRVAGEWRLDEVERRASPRAIRRISTMA